MEDEDNNIVKCKHCIHCDMVGHCSLKTYSFVKPSWINGCGKGVVGTHQELNGKNLYYEVNYVKEMRYAIIINDSGGGLTYYKGKPFNIGMLDLDFINNYREIENDTLNKILESELNMRRRHGNPLDYEREIYKVYTHINNLNYDKCVIGTTTFQFNIVNTKQVYVPEPKAIYINYDFVSGKELSYGEGLKATSTFETNCLNFFDTDRLTEWNDVIVRNKNNEYISCSELLKDSSPYIEKDIRLAHNVHKMLVANSFKWQKNSQ